MSQDTLSEVLRTIRLRGALIYHVEANARWVSEAPAATAIAAAVMPGVEHVMAYHVVTQGRCWAALTGPDAARPVLLRPGDVVVYPRGDAHVMSSDPGMRGTLDLSGFDLPRPEQLPYFGHRRGDSAEMVPLPASESLGATLACGFFGCDARPFNPLLDALPQLLHIPACTDGDDWIAHFVRFAIAESTNKRSGGEALLERLSETMFVELIRRYVATLPEDETGWLAALRDRYVGRALAFLHDRPGEAWTIDRLSDRVGLSRSALHERFLQFVGTSPMHYLARWRMQVAAGLLRQSSATMAAIALEVGYESEAAFSRAFRRATGSPPATWRRAQSQPTAPA